MLSFLKANYLTIIIIAVLVLIVALIIRSLVKDKKSGKSSCGGDCSSCGWSQSLRLAEKKISTLGITPMNNYSFKK